ncbi:hypothetical protein Q8G81_35365, partial [Klebsiella pneumoniae]
GLKPFGLPQTEALLDIARMTGSERLAGMALEVQKIRDIEREATVPAAFDAFQAAWRDACVGAWDEDDARAEPRVILPDWL